MIVVADDLGGGRDKDAAIISLLDSELVDVASVLVNGSSFADAAKDAAPFADRVGVHLVLTEGEPLTEPVRHLRRFCDGDGRFRGWRASERALRLGPEERAAVRAEWLAQCMRLREAGFAITHADSHHHVHTDPGLAGLALAVARELRIPRVRLARNWGAGIGPLNRAWKTVLNARIRRAGLASTRWFGGLADYLHEADRRPGRDDFELMVHPLLAPDGRIEDEEMPGRALDERLRDLRQP